MFKNRSALAYIKKYYPVILIALIITVWFPMNNSWSDFHNYVFSLDSPGYLYQSDQFKPFFFLPWAIPLLYPFTFISLSFGWFVYNLLTLALIFSAIDQFDQQPNSLTLMVCFLNFFFILAISLGQWEGILLGFIALTLFAVRHNHPYLLGLGLLLLTTKPIHVWLVGVVFLWHVRSWPTLDKVRILAIPSAACLASLLLFSQWPGDYIQFVRATPPPNIVALDFSGSISIPLESLNPSVWLIAVTAIVFIGFLLYGHPSVLASVAAALCANLMLTSYLQLYHFVLLIPAIILLGKHSRPMRLIVVFYIMTIPLQFFLYHGQILAYMPLVLLLLLFYTQTTNPTYNLANYERDAASHI